MKNIKTRLLTGWNFQRALYLVMGTFVIIQGIENKQWAAMAFGSYFAAMGLFSFGCAAGNCAMPSATKNDATTLDVAYEEIKIKNKNNEQLL
jgi:hypothetical protein